MRGRKPRPTVLKLMEGNPGKRPLNDREPTPPVEMPECPEFLDARARAEWDRTVPVLAKMGLLTAADRSALAAYCVAYSRWVQAEAQVARFGTIVKSPEKGLPDEVAVSHRGRPGARNDAEVHGRVRPHAFFPQPHPCSRRRPGGR